VRVGSISYSLHYKSVVKKRISSISLNFSTIVFMLCICLFYVEFVVSLLGGSLLLLKLVRFVNSLLLAPSSLSPNQINQPNQINHKYTRKQSGKSYAKYYAQPPPKVLEYAPPPFSSSTALAISRVSFGTSVNISSAFST